MPRRALDKAWTPKKRIAPSPIRNRSKRHRSSPEVIEILSSSDESPPNAAPSQLKFPSSAGPAQDKSPANAPPAQDESPPSAAPLQHDPRPSAAPLQHESSPNAASLQRESPPKAAPTQHTCGALELSQLEEQLLSPSPQSPFEPLPPLSSASTEQPQRIFEQPKECSKGPPSNSRQPLKSAETPQASSAFDNVTLRSPAPASSAIPVPQPPPPERGLGDSVSARGRSDSVRGQSGSTYRGNGGRLVNDSPAYGQASGSRDNAQGLDDISAHDHGNNRDSTHCNGRVSGIETGRGNGRGNSRGNSRGNGRRNGRGNGRGRGGVGRSVIAPMSPHENLGAQNSQPSLLYGPLPPELRPPSPTTSDNPSLLSSLPLPPSIPSPRDAISSLANRSLTLTNSLPKKKPKKKKSRRKPHSLPPDLPCPSEETLKSLNEMWQEYAVKALGAVDEARVLEAATRLDLHGSVVKVVRGRHAGWVGMKGIVVAETTGLLWLAPCLGEADGRKGRRLRKIPKDGVVVKVSVGKRDLVYNLPALVMRSSERSARKFKRKNIRMF